ncbi:hypothetical protein MRX96_041149 [Rhipicephalus microplus]
MTSGRGSFGASNQEDQCHQQSRLHPPPHFSTEIIVVISVEGTQSRYSVAFVLLLKTKPNLVMRRKKKKRVHSITRRLAFHRGRCHEPVGSLSPKRPSGSHVLKGGGCSPGDAVILPGRGAESCQAVHGKGRPNLEGGGWSPGHAVILPGPGTESCQAVHGNGRYILEGGGCSPGNAKILPGPGAVFIPRVNITGSGVDKERYEPVALSRPGSIREVWAS